MARPRRKAMALILRYHRTDKQYELLTLWFKGLSGLRLPGGGIYRFETIEQGLYREIEEESGLRPDQLRLMRKLGVARYYKMFIQADVERHDYLFFTDEKLPDTWQHTGTGDGGDADNTFHFQWIRPDALERMDDELRTFITPEHIPEWFGED